MKKTLLILVLLFVVNMLNAQLQGRYVADYRKDIEYSINFLEDGIYYMDMVEHLTNDVLDKRTMSIGLYSREGNIINLIDKIHNFRMTLGIINDSLKMNQSFYFIKGKVFGFKSNYVDMYTINWLKNQDSLCLKKDREEFRAKNQKLYTLKFGDYYAAECVQCTFEYRLTISRDNIYHLYLNDLLISEGNWVREGVELILFDNSLKHRFYIMVANRVLVSKLLPGDYQSVTLKRKPLNPKK